MTDIDFVAEAARRAPDLIALRRELHRIPELGNDLPQTQARVLAALDGLPLEITTGRALTSITAVLRGTGTRPDDRRPCVLLRGDMDALPIDERTGLDFASTNGAMHACGHDLHTAGLVGAAALLSAHRDELPGDVVFMFQPGEEGPGGAGPMIEEGVLEAAGPRPDAAYGIHVQGQLPAGRFLTRAGTLMAGANELTVVVHGKGGHGSSPYTTKDPVPVAAEIVLALQTYVTRFVHTFDPVVISVTQLSTGSRASNVISDQARLKATVRTLSRESWDRLAADLPRLAHGIASAYGMTADVDFVIDYPVTVNDDAETAWVVDELSAAFGADRVALQPDPRMGAEDFSLVLEEVPGTYVFLGAQHPESDDPAPSNHSARVMFDDSVLGDQAAALARLAHARMHR